MNKILFRAEQLIPKDCPHLQTREHTAESPSQTRERYLVVVTCVIFFVFSLKLHLAYLPNFFPFESEY